jgi:hypothetical protein
MNDSFAALRRFVRDRAPAPAEPCELCSAALAADHQHLLDPQSRQLVCCCEPCAILFSSAAEIRYRRVPRDSAALVDFRLTDVEWDGLLIPINVAFFVQSSESGRVVALYPSPAGAMESLLSLETWADLQTENPVLRELQPDVEALLINRLEGAREYYRVPIDECYRLIGLIRANWRGLSGGAEVWREIRRFFAELRQRSEVRGARAHA